MRAGGWLVWALAGLAAVTAGLAALPLPRRFAGDSGLSPLPPAAPAAVRVEVSLASLLAWSPFGRQARPVGEAPAAKAELGLTLYGVVPATDSHASGAIVRDRRAPPESTPSDRRLAPLVPWPSFHANHVLLLVDGSPQTLAFPDDRGTPLE